MTQLEIIYGAMEYRDILNDAIRRSKPENIYSKVELTYEDARKISAYMSKLIDCKRWNINRMNTKNTPSSAS